MMDKKLKYLPLNNINIYNCYEYSCVSILNTYINQFDLLDQNAIRIKRIYENTEKSNVNVYNLSIDSDIYNLAEQYYGFHFFDFEKSEYNLLDIINEEIKNDRICIISMDLFWNNYKMDYYKKTHTSLHDQVLAGIKGNKYICYTWNNEYLLDQEDLYQGCLHLKTFLRTDKIKHVNCELLTSAILEICRKESSAKIILHDFYGQLLVLEAEKLYSSNTDLTKVSLFMNMRVMARSRERYGNYIQYLLDEYRDGFDKKEMMLYQKICNLLQNIADTWWKMSNLLLKYEYIYQQKKLIDNNKIKSRLLCYLHIIELMEEETENSCRTILS